MIAQTDQLERFFGLDSFLVRGPTLHVCERAWSWNPPPFTDFDFWLVLGGAGRLMVNGREYELVEGVGFLLQPGDAVAGSQNPDSPLTVFACHMQPRLPMAGDGRLSPGTLRFQVPDLSYYRRLGEEALHLTQKGDEPSAATLAKLIVGEMILRALLGHGRGQPGNTPKVLLDLALNIKSNPGGDWALKEMAQACFLSIPQFTRNFRRAFGTSPMRFVITQRILRSIHLLRESQASIQQIAADLGYPDHFFFHRQFKSIAGVTPLAVRQGAPTAVSE